MTLTGYAEAVSAPRDGSKHRSEAISANASRGLLTKVQWRNVSVLVVACAVTRALALFLGVRPLTSETAWFMQVLDLNLLHHHLARSLYHLHCQPPLLNALIGLAEKVSGPYYGQLITLFFVILGSCAVICVYLSLTLLRVSPTVSLCVSLLLLLNPAEILSEFDPFYTIPVIAIHCFMALATICYLQRRSLRSLYCLVGLAVLLTLTRSSYQWIWVIAVLAVVWWQTPQSRNQVRIAGFVALFLSLLWPLKNEVLFRHFISTTWGPLSMAKHWDWNGSAVQDMVRQGLVTTFAPPDGSEDAIRRQLQSKWKGPPTGFPELDDVTKKTGGSINWNSLAALRLNDARQKDIRVLLRHDPKEYVVSVLHSVAIYFYPSTQYYAMFGEAGNPLVELAQHYQPLRAIDTVVRRVCCNVFGLPPNTPVPSAAEGARPQQHRTFASVAKKLCVGALLLYGVVLVCVISFGRRSIWLGAQDRKVAAMVMSLTIAYSFVVVNLVEIGENQRYRFETQALVFMVVAVFLQQLWDRRRASDAGVREAEVAGLSLVSVARD